MLSFELSVIDIVLAMAIIILLLLFMTGGNTKNRKEPELSCKNWKDEILRRVTKGKEESLRRTKKKHCNARDLREERILHCSFTRRLSGVFSSLRLFKNAPAWKYRPRRMSHLFSRDAVLFDR